ncbi:hypothetical protein NMS_2063 [Nonlabens marinus S1-08]|uniref:Uncharacterized protein n=1 Tax=Nonlabens marinus S1-08 TaxID=1454201 RepID=W8VXK2_9FLAO|nr:hypothetical protein NMS_2063 [Nonlabens marinus S1-08]
MSGWKLKEDNNILKKIEYHENIQYKIYYRSSCASYDYHKLWK